MKKMSVTEMEEARHKIVAKMTGALARSNMRRFDQLNTKYQVLSEEIRRRKND